MLKNKFDEVIYKKFEKEEKQQKNEINNKVTNELIIPSSTNRGKKSKQNRHKKKSSKLKSQNSDNLFLKQNQKNNNKVLGNKVNKKQEKIINKPDTDYEFNWLSYEEALRYDKRSSCEYYGSLLKSKQLFIFTFCTFEDYNSGVIKKFMFFLSFALHYTVNALFFNDKNMHQIYEDEGKYNFGYQLPYILYSAIISTVTLRLMLQILVLTDKDILEVKLQQNKALAVNMKQKKLKCIKIKFAIFFILNFILLTLFWYYLTCFNAIYENTQVYLIENTFISFAFSLFYPFIINLIPMIIRNCSLQSSNKDQRCFYKVSQIIQVI